MSFTVQQGGWRQPGNAMRFAGAGAEFRFPFQSFSDAAAFHDFMTANRTLIDMRYAYESALAAHVQAQLLISTGSCGLCLRATEFATFVPEKTEGGAVRAPNFREEQACGCADGLNARFRGLLQFIYGEIGVFPWMRVLVLGAAQCIEPRLRPLVASLCAQARSGQVGEACQVGNPPYHLIIASEYLHAVPLLGDTLAALHGALVPGGHLLFTAPFETAAAVSRAHDDGPVLGWDILDLLAASGFAAAAAHLFWSEEFGYLGPFNMIFSAAAV